MLRELRPDVTIDLFLHIPFPPVELFAQLPWRRSVMEGMSGADLVGFHLPGGAENFVVLARRMLELDTGAAGPQVVTNDVHHWARTFLDVLAAAGCANGESDDIALDRQMPTAGLFSPNELSTTAAAPSPPRVASQSG